MKRFLPLLLSCLIALPASAEETAQSVLACMSANVPSTLRIREIVLETSDRAGGTRTLSGKLYAKREPSRERQLVRAMLALDAPAELKGAAYLIRQSSEYRKDGMYVYLPAVKRVRQITGSFADGALMGTDFSYSEFRQIESAFGGAQATLESGGEIDGRVVNVLRFAAREDSRYSSVIASVDRASCVPLRVEFFEGDAVRKELSVPAAALTKSGDFWYPAETTMRDVKEGTKTVLRILKVTSGKEIPASYFDPHLFYNLN